MAFTIKAEVRDPRAKSFASTAQNTMYGGQGLVVRGIVNSPVANAKKRGHCAS